MSLSGLPPSWLGICLPNCMLCEAPPQKGQLQQQFPVPQLWGPAAVKAWQREGSRSRSRGEAPLLPKGAVECPLKLCFGQWLGRRV